MKLRLLPALLTFVIASGLLFGGYFFYQVQAVDRPLEADVSGTEGVAHAEVATSRTRIEIRLQLERDADLRTVYRAVQQLAEERGTGRELVIELDGEPTPELLLIWQNALFHVAEAMDNRRYGDVPRLMDQLQHDHAGLTAHAAMDEGHIYVTLRLDGSTLYRVLPLDGGRMGVWPNGQVR